MRNRTNKPRPDSPEIDPLLTPKEAGELFRVDASTVTRWSKAGKLSAVLTLGGHRRYREADVRQLLADGYQPATPSAGRAQPAHTVQVEALTAEMRATDPTIPENAKYAVIERGTGGSLIKVSTTDVTAMELGVSISTCAMGHATTVGATYVPAVDA